MRDDNWVAKYTAELIANRLTRGLLMLEDHDEMVEREEEIKELFIGRFGQKRADKLWKTIKISSEAI